MMKSKIEIFTSYIEEGNIERIKSMNLLPVFIIRSVGKLEYIEKWAGTLLHFRELAPSKELFKEYKTGQINQEIYFKRFVIELANIDFQDIILRFESLAESSGADGICLCGLGIDPNMSHRSIVSDILWRTGYLEFKPREI